jgi:hypothetical protein
VRVAEVHVDAGLHGERLVGGHLVALIPGQRASEVCGQPRERDRDLVGDMRGGVVVEFDEHAHPGAAFHDRRDRARVVLAEDEVAFPVAGNGAVFDLGRSFGDVDHVFDSRTGGPVAGVGFAAHAT